MIQIAELETTPLHIPIFGGISRRTETSTDEPSLNMMLEMTEGYAKSQRAICPLMDGTHECIPAWVLGQLFFAMILLPGAWSVWGRNKPIASHLSTAICGPVPSEDFDAKLAVLTTLDAGLFVGRRNGSF